jgi:hypothetical protein
LGNRAGWRVRKFYTEQVNKLLALIKRQLQESMSVDQYLNLKEQMGEDPDLDEMPTEISDYPLEVQESFLLHTFLPDRWDGASGTYMGKDWSALESLLRILKISDWKTSVFFLKHIEAEHIVSTNDGLKRQEETRARRAKN